MKQSNLSALNETKVKKELESFLIKVTRDKSLHARYLNTLAFMEHIGSRKILKSQNSAKLNLTVLQHISEEARHAFYFKSLAHKISPADSPNFKETYMINGSASESYFQAVDRKAEKDLNGALNSKQLNYLYTTWMIEERAVMLYQIYNRILKSQGAVFNLDFVLREEDHHLKTTVQLIKQKDPDFKKRAKRLFKYETEQFTNLIKCWQSDINNRT